MFQGWHSMLLHHLAPPVSGWQWLFQTTNVFIWFLQNNTTPPRVRGWLTIVMRRSRPPSLHPPCLGWAPQLTHRALDRVSSSYTQSQKQKIDFELSGTYDRITDCNSVFKHLNELKESSFALLIQNEKTIICFFWRLVLRLSIKKILKVLQFSAQIKSPDRQISCAELIQQWVYPLTDFCIKNIFFFFLCAAKLQ